MTKAKKHNQPHHSNHYPWSPNLPLVWCSGPSFRVFDPETRVRIPVRAHSTYLPGSHMARRGGFEPPWDESHWISNPAQWPGYATAAETSCCMLGINATVWTHSSSEAVINSIWSSTSTNSAGNRAENMISSINPPLSLSRNSITRVPLVALPDVSFV